MRRKRYRQREWYKLFCDDPRTMLRRREISFSQGAKWNAPISTYIGTIPLNGETLCAAEHITSGAPWRRKSAKPPPTASGPRRAPQHGCNARFRFGRRSSRHLFVAVVVTPPDALFVASLRRTVEPLVHAPEAVQSAGIGRIGVIDDAVLKNESAEARPLAHIAAGSTPDLAAISPTMAGSVAWVIS